MKIVPAAVVAGSVIFASAGLAFAQDDAMQGHEMPELPKACQTGKAPAMPGMMESMQSAMQGMDQAHQGLHAEHDDDP